MPRRSNDLSKSLKIATSKLRAADNASRGGRAIGTQRELIGWLNDYLGLDAESKGKDVAITKLSQIGYGNHACQILDSVTKGRVLRMGRIRFGSTLTEQEKLTNWKEFQRALEKLKVNKEVDVNRLSKGLATDCLDLLKWLKALWNSMDTVNDYDPQERRARAHSSLNSQTKKPSHANRQEQYAGPNSNERAAKAAARRAKIFNDKKKQNVDASFDSHQSKSSQLSFEEQQKAAREKKKEVIMAKKQRQQEMKKAKEKEELEKKIKQQEIKLKRHQVHQQELEQKEKEKVAKQHARKQRQQERKMRQDEGSRASVESSISDLTTSPRPHKRKPKRGKERRQSPSPALQDENANPNTSLSSANSKKNHRWRDDNVPPPNQHESSNSAASPSSPKPQFLSAAQKKMYEKQKEIQRKQKTQQHAAAQHAVTQQTSHQVFKAPTVAPSTTANPSDSLMQLLAQHPKLPKDSIMQQELQLVGLTDLVNELLDGDANADVDDLLQIYSEEKQKVSKVTEKNKNKALQCRNVKSYYYGNHGQLMVGEVDKLERLKTSPRPLKPARVAKKLQPPKQAQQRESKLLQPGWAAGNEDPKDNLTGAGEEKSMFPDLSTQQTNSSSNSQNPGMMMQMPMPMQMQMPMPMPMQMPMQMPGMAMSNFSSPEDMAAAYQRQMQIMQQQQFMMFQMLQQQMNGGGNEAEQLGPRKTRHHNSHRNNVPRRKQSSYEDDRSVEEFEEEEGYGDTEVIPARGRQTSRSPVRARGKQNKSYSPSKTTEEDKLMKSLQRLDNELNSHKDSHSHHGDERSVGIERSGGRGGGQTRGKGRAERGGGGKKSPKYARR